MQLAQYRFELLLIIFHRPLLSPNEFHPLFSYGEGTDAANQKILNYRTQ